MLDGVVGQRVDAPGVERGHGELDADGHERVDDRDEDDERVGAQERKAHRRHRDDRAAHEHGLAHPVAVEQPAGEEAGDGADERSGKQREPAHRGGLAQRALDVERHDGLHAHERRLEQRNDHDGRAVVARAQDAHPQHGLLERKLSARVEPDQGDARDDEDGGDGVVGARAERRQAVEQANQANRGEGDRRRVEPRALERAEALERQAGDGEDDRGGRRDDDEDGTPADVVDEQPHVGHDVGQRRREQRRVEDREERAREQHGHHAQLLAGDAETHRQTPFDEHSIDNEETEPQVAYLGA